MRNPILLVLLLFSLASTAQVTNKIQADSVRIYQNGGRPGELILESSTKHLSGAFLQNWYNGRSKWAYAVDSVYQVGSQLKFRIGPNTLSVNLPPQVPYAGAAGVDVNQNTGFITAPGKVDSLKILNDSVIYFKNGVAAFAGSVSGLSSDQEDKLDSALTEKSFKTIIYRSPVCYKDSVINGDSVVIVGLCDGSIEDRYIIGLNASKITGLAPNKLLATDSLGKVSTINQQDVYTHFTLIDHGFLFHKQAGGAPDTMRIVGDTTSLSNRIDAIDAAAGIIWRNGTTAPDNTTAGVNGDYYLNSTTGLFYQKISGAYQQQGTLKGPTGPAGATPSISVGTVGSGTTPAVSISGTTAAPVLNFTLVPGTPGTNGVGFNYRGAWAPATPYAVNDIVTNGGNAYRVSAAHTSPGSFATTNLDLFAAKGLDGTGSNGSIITVGTATTLAPGSSVTISDSDPGADVTLNMGIPRGADGTGFNPRGAWTASTSYAVNDVVTNGGNTYRVVTAHTSGGSFATGNLELWAQKGLDGSGSNGSVITIGSATALSAGATPTISDSDPGVDVTLNIGIPAGADGADGTGFQPRGPWLASTAYAVNDVVTNGGNTYRVSTAFTSPATFNTTNLELWAQRGSDGLDGTDGTDGTNGSNGTGFTPKPFWSASTIYTENDIVPHEGQTYRVVTSHTSTSAFDATKFQLWAQKGQDATSAYVIASGDATGAIDWGTNVNSADVNVTGTYSRIGNIVHFSGTFLAQVASTGVTSFVSITLPVLGDLSLEKDVTGTVSSDFEPLAGRVYADPSLNKLVVEWRMSQTGLKKISFECTYKITQN